MATNVEAINVTLGLGNINTNSSTVTAFLGIGGREFRLNLSGQPDFVTNKTLAYVIGLGSNIENSSLNDPSKVTDEDIDFFPQYIRLEFTNQAIAEIKNLAVIVSFSGGDSKKFGTNLLPISLSETAGKTLYLCIEIGDYEFAHFI